MPGLAAELVDAVRRHRRSRPAPPAGAATAATAVVAGDPADAVVAEHEVERGAVGAATDVGPVVTGRMSTAATHAALTPTMTAVAMARWPIRRFHDAGPVSR